MIKPEELRIGNVVDLGIVSGVDQSTKIIKLHNGFSFPTEKISGEPINKEWLVKFGFEKTKTGYAVFKGDGAFQRIIFFLRERDGSFLYGDGVNIIYLHQLQNLYFALTGEELVIQK